MTQYTKTSIWTGSGYLDFSQDPIDVSSIDIDTIARALSRAPRFAGLSDRFYSVAQHSVVLSLYYDSSPELAKYSLLHDATEAFMCDLPAPLKSLLPEYERIEKRLLDAILDKFGVENLSQVIMNVDKLLAHWEAEAINLVPPPWLSSEIVYTFTSRELACRINRNKDWSHVLLGVFGKALPLTQEAAEAAFLLRYRELFE